MQRNAYHLLAGLLFLTACGPGETTAEETAMTGEESNLPIGYERKASDLDRAVAHVLVQDFAYDATDKTRVDGPYKDGGTFDVPLDLSGQNKWFMFEGPVLENDKVAYRTYADSRHRFDVYGKRVADIVMDTVSWQYHDIMDWGSDILKVGNSLGIGSPGIWYKDSVYTLSDYDRKEVRAFAEEDGVAAVRFRFDGLRIGDQQFNLDQTMRLAPGRYDMEVEMVVRDGELPEGMTFVTGIVKHLPEATSGKENGFTYVQNWGRQSYHEENMGMAVLAAQDYGPRPGADELSHLLHFDDARKRVAYRVLTGWEQDQSGTTDATGFSRMVTAATK